MGKKAQGESEAQWLKVRVCWVDIEECESGYRGGEMVGEGESVGQPWVTRCHLAAHLSTMSRMLTSHHDAHQDYQSTLLHKHISLDYVPPSDSIFHEMIFLSHSGAKTGGYG